MPQDWYTTDESQDGPKQRYNSSSSSNVRKRIRKQSKAWPIGLACKLVLVVEMYEQLWNSSHINYKKASRQVWEEIAVKMDRTTEDCINKWGSLRSNFKVCVVYCK